MKSKIYVGVALVIFILVITNILVIGFFIKNPAKTQDSSKIKLVTYVSANNSSSQNQQSDPNVAVSNPTQNTNPDKITNTTLNTSTNPSSGTNTVPSTNRRTKAS
jgi:hypothetical protein